MVSTEDAEIAELARRYGAEVDLRPQSLAEDQATVADVCVELLARKPLPWGDVQQMCVLYATAPLRNANDIREVMALLEPGVRLWDYRHSIYPLSVSGIAVWGWWRT